MGVSVPHSETFATVETFETTRQLPAGLVIALVRDDRYDRDNRSPSVEGVAPVEEEAELLRHLAAGEWLSPSEAALLAHVHRSTFDRWIRSGVTIGGRQRKIGYTETAGGHRSIDPADLRALLAELQRRRTAGEDEPGDASGSAPDEQDQASE